MEVGSARDGGGGRRAAKDQRGRVVLRGGAAPASQAETSALLVGVDQGQAQRMGGGGEGMAAGGRVPGACTPPRPRLAFLAGTGLQRN